MKVIELEVKIKKEDKIIKEVMKFAMIYEGDKGVLAIQDKKMENG